MSNKEDILKRYRENVKVKYDMPSLDDIVFAAWDVFPANAYESAINAEVLKEKDIEPVKDELLKIKPIKVFTSSAGRPQFSSEKAKSERYLTPFSTAASTQARTLSTPLAWPYTLSLPLSFAHLPFPSIMMETCVGTFSCVFPLNSSIS